MMWLKGKIRRDSGKYKRVFKNFTNYNANVNLNSANYSLCKLNNWTGGH